MSDPSTRLLNERTRRLEEALGRPLPSPEDVESESSPLEPDKRSYLLEEAEDLYWNELEWERLTAEEHLDEGAIVELTFPGFLAFIRGLLLEEALPDTGIDAIPRPSVVKEVLRFLAYRAVELREEIEQGAEDEVAAGSALTLTLSLIDVVLFRLHDLTGEEEERVAEALEAG